MKKSPTFFLTILALLFAQASYGGEKTTDANQQVIVVTGSKSTSSITLGGTVIPSLQVKLNAEFPGRIEYLAGDIGDEFDRHTILVQIDDVELRAKRAEAIAQISIADANYRNARVQYDRAMISPDYNPMTGSMPKIFNKFPMRLFGGNEHKGIERYSNVYQHQAQMEQARAALRQAEARLEQLDSKIRDAQTVAPFSGVIIRKFVEVGDTIQPGQPILEFADLRRLQMQIDVPDRLIGGLKEGMLLPAKIDSINIHMDVQIDKIYPVADLQKHTVKVELNLPRNLPASPGMYAEVLVPNTLSKKKPNPIVPKSALVWRGTLPAVTLLNSANKTELRLVRTGKTDGKGNVEILSGINIGDKILASPKRKGWQKKSDESDF